jgi:GntP family gluconate:H+ symporter
MSSNTPLLLYALGAVVVLIVLIARFKLHPFVALIVVSLGMGTVAGMPLGGVVKVFLDGVGGVLGFIAIVVGLGTMLGKMMAESGGATRIATTLITLFGEKRVHWAIMFVAFIVGIPVFFQVGFVLLIPLVFTIARRTGLSLVKIGIPLVAGLSVVHGMVPPHPAAMLAVGAYKADVGRTIVYAVLVGLPTASLAGPIFASWIAPRIALPAENPIAAQFVGARHAGLWHFALHGAATGDPDGVREHSRRNARQRKHHPRGRRFRREPDRLAARGAALLLLVAGIQAALHA